MQPMYIILTLCSILLCSIYVQAHTTLSVYHKRGGDYLKRGDIIDIPSAPKYVPVQHGEGDLTTELYQVKIKNDETGHIILSSIPSCHLKASNFSDQFRIHLDDQQRVYHVDYYASTFDCDPVTETIRTNTFNSDIQIIKMIPGAKPIQGQFNGKTKSKPVIKKQQQQQEGAQDEDVEEDKTFFQKYWYLILAGALMLLSNAVAPPEPSQQQSQARR
ncbi:uncharacterized protein BX664DRAFT_337472 [Halteromyces radiatus]|uniref:uncharacterized protein n=1 Tax=Halteromyces radiatus TaxID=101107 RepID=UPI002220FE9C|nr:uncharacterized protein BX664DRAFT_337472 [Halteromyces radiatus]KAI8084644.1 hypothetical protein BX664DRAFT_337472 [Halteromyces radiatus]